MLPVDVTVLRSVNLVGSETKPHDAAVPLVVRYLPLLPVCDGNGDFHATPAAAVESAVSTVSFDPTATRAGVLSAVAAMRSPLASTSDAATAPT